MMQDFIDYIASLGPELNEFAAQINNQSTNATSASAVSIGIGSKTFVTQTDKGSFVGMALNIAVTADVTQFMVGLVTSYNPTTGDLTVNVTQVNGSGTYNAWSISFTVQLPSEVTFDSITSTTSVLGNVTITGGTIVGTTVDGHTVGSNSVGTRTISTSSPSGGSAGDIWYRY
jgi:hypothetical protein